MEHSSFMENINKDNRNKENMCYMDMKNCKDNKYEYNNDNKDMVHEIIGILFTLIIILCVWCWTDGGVISKDRSRKDDFDKVHKRYDHLSSCRGYKRSGAPCGTYLVTRKVDKSGGFRYSREINFGEIVGDSY